MSAVLVLGGARSGKSRFAQDAALAASGSAARPVYVATGAALDLEMAERIARHRIDRADRFETREAPLDLAGAVAGLGPRDAAVVDCLTLWLSNSLAEGDGHLARTEELLWAVERCPAKIWLVGNEVGWGIVPDNELARRFRDEAGRLHQELASRCAEAFLVAAGLPLRLK